MRVRLQVMACAPSQVIPDNLRSSAYAFDKGITGLLGALAAPLVGASAMPAGIPFA